MIGALTAVIVDEAKRIWCHKWLAAGVGLGIFALGGAYVLTLPDVYDAWGQVFVNKQTPVAVATQGVALVGEGYGSPYLVQKTLLNDDNLQTVVRRFDPRARTMSKVELEAAATALKRRIVIAPDLGDGFFEVHFRDTDPQRARQVVQLMLDQFIDRNVARNEQELRHAGKFLDEQIASYEAMLADSQAKIAAFRARNPRVAALSVEPGLAPAAAAAAPAAADGSAELAAARAAYEAAVAQGHGAVAQTPARASALADRVSTLQAKLAALRTEYTDQYPDVVATKRQLDDAIAQLGAETAAAPAAKPAAEESPELAAARRRLAMAQRAGAPRVAPPPPPLPPAVQSEWTELQRNDEVLRINYQQLITRREAARLSEAVYGGNDAGKYQITRKPTTPTLPIGPKRGLYLAVILAAAIFGGLAAAYLRAAIAGIFVSPRELEHAFQLPVVGTVAWEPAWSTQPRGRPTRPFAALRATLSRGVAPLNPRTPQ
jgi:uncharacterized protein involved in exopolysaccharide biosynthesis